MKKSNQPNSKENVTFNNMGFLISVVLCLWNTPIQAQNNGLQDTIKVVIYDETLEDNANLILSDFEEHSYRLDSMNTYENEFFENNFDTVFYYSDSLNTCLSVLKSSFNQQNFLMFVKSVDSNMISEIWHNYSMFSLSAPNYFKQQISVYSTSYLLRISVNGDKTEIELYNMLLE